MPRKRLKKMFSDKDLEEFRALVNNLVPTTLEQAEWIYNEAERTLHEYPELKEKLQDWEEMSEEEREEAEKVIATLLKRIDSERKARARAEEAEGKDES